MQFSFIEFEKHNFCVSSKDCSIEVNKLHFYRKTKKTSGTKTKEAAQPKSICCPKEVRFLQTIKDFLIKKEYYNYNYNYGGRDYQPYLTTNLQW